MELVLRENGDIDVLGTAVALTEEYSKLTFLFLNKYKNLLDIMQGAYQYEANLLVTELRFGDCRKLLESQGVAKADLDKVVKDIKTFFDLEMCCISNNLKSAKQDIDNKYKTIIEEADTKINKYQEKLFEKK